MPTPALENNNGCFAMLLDGTGFGRPLDDCVDAWREDDNNLIWLNIIDGLNAETDYGWLYNNNGLDGGVLESLTAHRTRPRFYTHGNGLMVIVRTLNSNQDVDDINLHSIRIWLSDSRIVTFQRRPVDIIETMRQNLINGNGPLTSGDFLVMLKNQISLDMADFLNNLDNNIDDLEDDLLTEDTPELRQNLSEIRRRIIHLRRHLTPQREVALNLQALKIPLLSDANRADLREVGDRLTRYVEMLDSGRERSLVAQDELDSRLKTQTNRTIFVLSVVTVIFLPLSFLAGLLGINVGGIPGNSSKYAFALVCIIMLIIAAFEYWLFRKKKIL